MNKSSKITASELVLSAIFFLQQKNGVSAKDITKFICEKRGCKQNQVRGEVKRALERATENGIFSKKRGLYRIESGFGRNQISIRVKGMHKNKKVKKARNPSLTKTADEVQNLHEKVYAVPLLAAASNYPEFSNCNRERTFYRSSGYDDMMDMEDISEKDNNKRISIHLLKSARGKKVADDDDDDDDDFFEEEEEYEDDDVDYFSDDQKSDEKSRDTNVQQKKKPASAKRKAKSRSKSKHKNKSKKRKLSKPRKKSCKRKRTSRKNQKKPDATSSQTQLSPEEKSGKENKKTERPDSPDVKGDKRGGEKKAKATHKTEADDKKEEKYYDRPNDCSDDDEYDYSDYNQCDEQGDEDYDFASPEDYQSGEDMDMQSPLEEDPSDQTNENIPKEDNQQLCSEVNQNPNEQTDQTEKVYIAVSATAKTPIPSSKADIKENTESKTTSAATPKPAAPEEPRNCDYYSDKKSKRNRSSSLFRSFKKKTDSKSVCLSDRKLKSRM